jgi:uroporphyrinogen decarboxylase
MHRRDRLQRTIAGEAADRPPVVLWRHFPGDDQRAADLTRSLVRYQQHFDFDLVVAAPSVHFSVTGYGLQDAWQGSASGQRTVIRPGVQRSLDWTTLGVLDPLRGDSGKQLQCLNLLEQADALRDVPFVQVIYSPLTQAAHLAGRDMLLRHLRSAPDRLHSGLNSLTESTLRFIHEMRRTAAAGILYMMDMANYGSLSLAEYQAFGVPYDRKILDSLPDNRWFNVAYLPGLIPMLSLAGSYPVQVLGWQDADGQIALDEADIGHFNGAIWGGLSAHEHLVSGTPAMVRDAVRQALTRRADGRLIVGCGAPLPVTVPLSNLQAARDVVQI